MNKKERVIGAIRRQNVDGVPSSFSLHFGLEKTYGTEVVDAHLRFFEETDTDVIKIMNENLVPCIGRVQSAVEYERMLPDMTLRDPFMVRQMDLTKAIMDRMRDSAFSIGTMHGVVASGLHALKQVYNTYDEGRNLQTALFRDNPKRMLQAMQRITNVLCELAKAYIRAGLDGVYYASLGGESRFFTDDEFAEWIVPLDLQVMQAIQEAGGFCFLHVCKDQLNMKRYAGYSAHADVINWGVCEAPMSLLDGRKLFPEKCILGGFPSHQGILEYGTEADIQQAIDQMITAFGKEGFILGADCALGTNQDRQKIRIAVEAARKR